MNKASMNNFRIERLNDGCRTIVLNLVVGKMFAIQQLMAFARKECQSLPNNPQVYFTSNNSVGVFIGQYKISEFFLLENSSDENSSEISPG